MPKSNRKPDRNPAYDGTMGILEGYGEYDPPKIVTQQQYDLLYAEREQQLDNMPGGAQGVQPDMSDVEVQN